MKKALLIFVLVLFSQSIYSQQKGAFYIQLNNNGITSNIYFYVPEDYDSTKVYPMLWGWHGAGMPGGDMVNLLRRMQNEIKGIIVCPDANNATTNDQFNSLINYSYNYPRQTYKIDTTKIIVTGYSWGGNMCYQLGLLNPSLVRGVIGIAPAIGAAQMTQGMWDNIKKTRMATILGTLDFNYSAVSSLMKDIQNKGGSLLYIEKEGLDHPGTNGYFGRQEFIDDYMQCYNFVLNQATYVSEEYTEFNNSLVVSPNPASSYIKVTSEIPGSIQIINPSGITVMSVECGMQTDISSLPNGIYFIKAGYSIKKFVKIQ
jgi:hypothetical protein